MNAVDALLFLLMLVVNGDGQIDWCWKVERFCVPCVQDLSREQPRHMTHRDINGSCRVQPNYGYIMSDMVTFPAKQIANTAGFNF